MVQGSKLLYPARSKMTEDRAAKSFAALVTRISVEELADAAGRNIETARLWKKASRCPNTSSLINLGQVFPEVRSWVFAMLGEGLP